MKNHIKAIAKCVFVLAILILGYLYALNGRYQVLDNASSAKYLIIADKWTKSIIISKERTIVEEASDKVTENKTTQMSSYQDVTINKDLSNMLYHHLKSQYGRFTADEFYKKMHKKKFRTKIVNQVSTTDEERESLMKRLCPSE